MPLHRYPAGGNVRYALYRPYPGKREIVLHSRFPIQQRAHNPHRQSLLPGIGNLRPSTRRLRGPGRKRRHSICRALFRRRALHRRTERRNGNHQFPWPRKHLVRYPRGHSERPFARRQREDRDSSRRIDQLHELRLPPRSANMVLQDHEQGGNPESNHRRKGKRRIPDSPAPAPFEPVCILDVRCHGEDQRTGHQRRKDAHDVR